MIVRVNNLFYATALALVFSNAYCEQAPTTVIKNFGDSSFKITVECSKDFTDSSKEKVILSTIENLVKEIDPAIAAKEYLDYLKTTFEKLKENFALSSLVESKTIEESSQKMNLFMQEMMKDLNEKENVLKQSVYFSTFSDEAISEVNNSIGMTIQSFAIEINNISVQGNREIEKVKLEKDEEAVKETTKKVQLALQKTLNSLSDRFFDSVKNALEKHYKI